MRKSLLLILAFLSTAFLHSGLIQAEEASAVKLYGSLRSAILNKELKAGFYSFDAVSSISYHLEAEVADLGKTHSGAYAKGKFYAYIQTGDEYNPTYKFNVYDAETWDLEMSKSVSSTNAGNFPFLMFYNKADDKLYGYNHAQKTFHEINRETGVLTKVVQVAAQRFNGVAANASGIIYATTMASSNQSEDGGDLYTVDLSQGTCALVGSTGWRSNNICPLAIDGKTGRIYQTWLPQFGSNSKLIAIDPATATTTEIGSTPHFPSFGGLFIMEAGSSTDATLPASPTSVSVAYNVAGQLAAKLKAVAPTKAYDQTTALTENMTIKFYVDEVEAGTVSNVAPGAEAVLDYTFAAEGLHWVKAVASNTTGESPAVQEKTWAGFDTPLPVGQPVLTIQENGAFTLNWTAPAKGENNGEVDLANLQYALVRYPDMVEETTAKGVTTHSGSITSNVLRDYYYSITPVYGDKRGATVFTNHKPYGQSVLLPFMEDFNTEEYWGLQTRINENEDGNDWQLMTEYSMVRFKGNKNQSNAWLITPRIRMRQGVTYTIELTTKVGFSQTAFLDIYLMDKPEIPYGGTSALKRVWSNTAIPDTETAHTATYTAEQDGYFYFGFYNHSNPNVVLDLFSYSVHASAVDDAPADVTNLTITPAPLGELKATITFNAPTTMADGSPLTPENITRIEVYRGAEQAALARFENPTPGAEYSCVDESPIQYFNTYRVVCYNNNGNSAGVSAKQWVGEDYAKAVNHLVGHYDEATETITLNWEAPTGGFYGGYIDQSNLTYSVAFFVAGASIDDYITWARTKECTFSMPKSDLIQFANGDLDNIVVSYEVAAHTSMGAGAPYYVTVVLGDGYGVPFYESFPGAATTTKGWTTQRIEGQYSWYMVKTAPSTAPMAGMAAQDNDEGMAMFFQNASEYSEERLLGPQLNLTGVNDPVVTFYLFHRSAADKENNFFMLEGLDLDANFFQLSDSIAIDGFGWQKHEVHLNNRNANKVKEFRIVFRGRAASGNDFYLDNIAITDGTIEEQYPAVTDLTGEVTADGRYVQLYWTAPDFGNYTLVGYYIYQDGVKLSEYVTETQARVEIPADGNTHTYAVQVFYNEGLSALSNEVRVKDTAIENVGAEGIRAYANGQEIHLIGQQTPYHIYTAAGAEVANGVAEGHQTIRLTNGVYFVHMNGNVIKCTIY